ncbi:MAG TPA: sterol desaturase family protein [Terriglobales bacterium]|nr:sterol desaturase family protein [Terriglobales bacterium]
MPPTPDPLALRRGQAINRRNAVVAALCGCGPAALLAYLAPPTPAMWLAGLAAGFLWANFFEYALHRWLLHWAGSYPGEGHMLHHRSLGKPEEPLYVNLGGRAIFVVAMFVVNGVPVVLLDRLVFSQAGFFLHAGFAPGMLVAFSLYFIVTEQIHWRFHMGGWLPASLRTARTRHLAHHQHPDQDFSIFLPLFDRLLRTASR